MSIVTKSSSPVPCPPHHFVFQIECHPGSLMVFFSKLCFTMILLPVWKNWHGIPSKISSVEHGNEYPPLCHNATCSLNHYLLNPITLPSVDTTYYYWKISNTVRTIIGVINYIASYGSVIGWVPTALWWCYCNYPALFFTYKTEWTAVSTHSDPHCINMPGKLQNNYVLTRSQIT